MKHTRTTGKKFYTVAITAFLLLFVILTGCDVTGTGGVTPEVLSAEDIVPEAPGEGTGGTETPGEGSGGSETSSTDPANPTTWNAQQVYATAGYYVSHNGKTYENQWWVQGEEPGETNAWREVNADGSYVVYLQPGQENISDWSETVEYPGANYYVRYHGLEYRSRWHANAGEVPGTAAVWETVE